MTEYMPVVIDANYVSDYKIKITFDNGEEKIADFINWLEGEIFETLKDKKLFSEIFCRWLEYLLAKWSRYFTRSTL